MKSFSFEGRRPMEPAPISTWKSLIHLGRFQSPVGAGLLFWPCLWGLIVASKGLPPWRSVLIFAAGACLARAGGCIYNDWVDRDIDRSVTRTRQRPLASGQLTGAHAFLLLLLCALLSLAFFVFLPWRAQLLCGLLAVLVLPYPWLKRVTFWPQIYLGVLFSGGVWVGGFSIDHSPDVSRITLALLYGFGILWTLAYDTIYAYQDRLDDQALGLKSTAVFWAERVKGFLQVCWIGMGLCLGGIGVSESFPYGYHISLAAPLGHLMWQNRALRLGSPDQCFRLFQSNQWVGLGVSVALIIGFVLRTSGCP